MFHRRNTADFINDGQTRIGRIDGDPSHPPLLIEYRPMLPGDRRALRQRLGQFAQDEVAGIRAAEFAVVREVARRLVSWTLSDRSGNVRSITDRNVAAIEPHRLAAIATLVLGFQPGDDERRAADEENLMRGVRLLLAAPHLASRDCGDCQTYVYDETTGRRARQGGRPVPRPAGTAPPCRLPQIGCLKGTPENPHTLSPANSAAYRFYQQCRAVGVFPDDPIVRRTATLIARVEQSFAREQAAAQTHQNPFVRSAGPCRRV
jgi:hypothetical protein